LSFFIPYMLNIEEYGYYKLFTFYLSYVGLMHLGFNDGIYLEYGSYNYEQYDKERFRLYFRYIIIQQIFTFFILLLITFLFVHDSKRLLIFTFIFLNMIFINISKLYSFISQITQQYFIYSIQYFIEKTALILPVVFLYTLGIKQFEYVIYGQTVVNIILLLIFIIYYKDICFGRAQSFFDNIKEIKNILKINC